MDTIWQERWQALDEQLQLMVKKYGRSPNQAHKSLHALSQSLRAFGQDQFDFFWNGFKTGQLLPAIDLPSEHLFRATLDQVAFDMAIMEKIFGQRQQPEMEPALEKADKLAQAALNIAIDGGLLPACGVLTYFNKSANIRLIPYAPLALVGVPYTITKTSMDFLAIPHEVGHYVYHHASGLAAQLHALIPLYPNWINHWLEELFADIFGALVAGPVIGYSFQHILQDNSQERFVADDGIHPPDPIRPYAYSQTLRQLGYPQAALSLDNAWHEVLTRRHHPKYFTPHQAAAPAALPEARALLEQTAVTLLHYLTTERKIKQPLPWSEETEDLASLIPTFVARQSKIMQVALYQLTIQGKTVGVMKDGELENGRPLGSTQTWRDALKAEVRRDPKLLLPAQAWRPIFTAGHWPVKGPEGNSDGGL